ncbi:MAG TPA: hypothetical protein VGO62_03250, partial [Myxococcota bacterium]
NGGSKNGIADDAAQVAAPSASSAPSAAAGSARGAGAVEGKAAYRKIAVYKLEAAGVDDRVDRVITDAVVAELRKLDKTTVVGMDEIKAMLDLEAQKQMLGCSDASCIAEIAEALGVDGVVIGNLAVVGDGITIGLKHIDQHSATTLGQSTRRLNGSDPADVLAALGPMVQELFPDVPLKPGLSRGVAPEVSLRIHPPPLQPWVFWSLGGVSAAAVATGAVFTTWNALAYSAAVDKADASIKGPAIPGSDLNSDLGSVRGSFVGLLVCYGAAAVVGAGAGVSALFVDWDGVGAASAE